MSETHTKKYVDLYDLGVFKEYMPEVIEVTWAQYQALPNTKYTDGNVYCITDMPVLGVEIDDTTTAQDKVWSSSKTNTEISAKASASDLTNKTKTTRITVDTTGWSEDTTSQSGTTLYKKQISLNHVYVACPNVDIGANGVLPTSAEQEAYNLLQYVTVDDNTNKLYLYASATPSSSFYINVGGVD